MRVRAGLAGVVVAVAAGVATVTSTAAADPAANRLRAFSGCPAFLEHVRSRALPLVGPWGIGGGGIAVALPGAVRAGDLARASGPTEVEFSGTNVQEEGVDEPDLTKTDGRTLFVASGGRLSAVDVRARRPRLVDSLPLAEGWAHELLLHGKRLLVLSQGSPRPLPSEGRLGIRAPWPYPSRTTVTEVDVSEPARLRVVRIARARGRLSDRAARRPRRPHRALVADGARPPVRVAVGDERRFRTCDRAEPRGRRGSGRTELAARLHDPWQERRRDGARRARRLPERPAPAPLLGSRPRLGRHGRPRAWPRPGRYGRDPLRRAHRVCVAHEPLRRHGALGRAARRVSPAAADVDGRSTASTSRARRRRTTAGAAPSPACS